MQGHSSVATSNPGWQHWQCKGPEYIALPASTKLDQIWENCAEDQTSAPWMSKLEVGDIMFESMCPTFNTEGDELPLLRRKFIHTVGTVGKVEWVDMGGHPYTGIFQGSREGITRLSLAREPTPLLKPSMGLKFLRDGADSANLVAMFDIVGQESCNFFKNILSNHLPEPPEDARPLMEKFYTATNNIRQVRRAIKLMDDSSALLHSVSL